MESGERSRQAFIILGEPAKTSCPGKRAFNNPASGQQDKTLFGFGEFDDNQIDSVLSSVLAGLFARVALIRESNFHAVPGRLLNLFCQIGNLSAFLLIGRSDLQGQEVTEGVDRSMNLRSLLALISVVTGSFSTLGSGL